MTEEVVRFYVAEIATAVDYLHSKRIVHRYVQSAVWTMVARPSKGT